MAGRFVHALIARIAWGVFVAGILCSGARIASAQAGDPKGEDPGNARKVQVEPTGSVSGGPEAPVSRPGLAQCAAVDRSSIWQLVLSANPMLWPLAICSVVTLGYVLERWLALRHDRVVPPEFADRFLERLSSGKLDRERALELCRAHDSPAARVFAMVVGAWGQSGIAIRQLISHDAAGEVLELKRNLRSLERDCDAGPSAGLAGNGGRHHSVLRFARRPDRTCAGRDACAGHQPGADRHGVRALDRDRRRHVLLLFS